MEESAFKVKFNFQNFLKEDIEETEYMRISEILNADAEIVRKLASDFSNSVRKHAKVMDKDHKYSSSIDRSSEGKVIFIGDSITSDRESFAHIAESVFSDVVGLVFINTGVSGWRTTEYLDDFYFKVLSHEADIAHVMLGTNGVRRSRFSYGKCNVSPAEFEKNITYILKALVENGTRTIISTLPPYDLTRDTYDTGNWTINENDFADYNNIIRKASKETGCILNDMQDVYKSYQPTELLLEDGVHLNGKGHYLLAEKVIGLIVGIITGKL